MRNKGKSQKAKGKRKKAKVKGENRYGKYRIFLTLVCLSCILFAGKGHCDILRLKEISEGKEGNEVEILEERQGSFIVEVPKDEIEVIKRKRPTEMKLWKEKSILWEDTGDYITIYLPKSKIVLPEDYTGDVYDSAKVLGEQLESAAAEGRPAEATFWKGAGRIVGRILKRGKPLQGARLKVVNVSSKRDALFRIFGEADKVGEDFVFETTADEGGRYKFENIPLGEYDIYWSAPGTESWYRRLSERPDIVVRPGETVEYGDIEIK